MSTVADRVKRARLAAGLESQSELARRIGRRAQTVQAIESGYTKVSRYLPDIARVCDVSLTWLMHGQGDMRDHDRPPVPSVYTLQTLGEYPGQALAQLQIVDRAYAPTFQPGDLVLVQPVPDGRPQSHYVAIAGAERAGIRGVIYDTDGPVLITLHNQEATAAHNVRILGDLVEIHRNLLITRGDKEAL